MTTTLLAAAEPELTGLAAWAVDLMETLGAPGAGLAIALEQQHVVSSLGQHGSSHTSTRTRTDDDRVIVERAGMGARGWRGSLWRARRSLGQAVAIVEHGPGRCVRIAAIAGIGIDAFGHQFRQQGQPVLAFVSGQQGVLVRGVRARKASLGKGGQARPDQLASCG